MEILKRHKEDNMKDIVIMNRGCGHEDYYGGFHMRDGMNYCRKCIYHIWQKESGWNPDYTKDFVFPLYHDGIDYTKENCYEKN